MGSSCGGRHARIGMLAMLTVLTVLAVLAVLAVLVVLAVLGCCWLVCARSAGSAKAWTPLVSQLAFFSSSRFLFFCTRR